MEYLYKYKSLTAVSELEQTDGSEPINSRIYCSLKMIFSYSLIAPLLGFCFFRIRIFATPQSFSEEDSLCGNPAVKKLRRLPYYQGKGDLLLRGEPGKDE